MDNIPPLIDQIKH